MTVMIGVDPHKRSHTAVAIDGDDPELAAIEVRASPLHDACSPETGRHAGGRHLCPAPKAVIDVGSMPKADQLVTDRSNRSQLFARVSAVTPEGLGARHGSP